MRTPCVLILTILVGQSLARGADQPTEDLGLLEQQALSAAAENVAEAVVQIRTIGGLERVAGRLVAQGPTTGLVISPDGYIVSSAYNFAQQPTSILARLPSGLQLPLQLVARDRSRMLVLLKAEVDEPLPIATATPLGDINVGQWAVAVGRTFHADRVNVSVGIVSATNRMYGRVIQTDASTSVANYGGPLVDVEGRVLGILVPMSPQSIGDGSDSEVAGAEFYDSGIGFAVPLEHVLKMLPKWRQGDLLPGKLGVGLAPGSAYVEPPTITHVWPGSPADRAGWKSQDRIVAIDGQPVDTKAQLRFALVPHYAGDSFPVTLERDGDEIETSVTLTDQLPVYRKPFLGVLPMRTTEDKDSTSVEVRNVWPGGPAAEAGVRRGDRLVAIGEHTLNTIDEAHQAMKELHPEQSVDVTIERDAQPSKLSVQLGRQPEEILTAGDLPSATPKPDTEERSADVAAPLELKPLRLPEFPQTANYYQPENGPHENFGLLIWLSSGDSQQDLQMTGNWQDICRRDGLILLLAPPADPSGWRPKDLAYLARLTRAAVKQLPTDERRVVVGGQGKAGQLACAFALKRRSQVHGVVSLDGPLPRTLKIPTNKPNLPLAILAVESDGSVFAPLVRQDLRKLREAGYPATTLQRPSANAPDEPLAPATRQSIARWIDTLDRL